MRNIKTDLAGRNVLITGAASGIGRATALAAAARGGRLVLTDLRDEPLHAVAEGIRAAGGTVLDCVPADVSEHEAVAAMAERVHAAHGPMGVVMNIAGISTWGPVERLQHHHWQRMVDVNLMGPIHVIEHFVPPMIEARQGGHLVNVSSAAGLIGLPWHAAYSASKFGLRGVSEVLRFDLHHQKIGVALVCPGAVKTPLVGTVEIVGVDREHPSAKKLHDHFVKSAQTPEQVAEKIVRGVERGTYIVYTSPDIRAAFLLQRYLPPAYEAIMMLLNKRLVAVGRKASV
jgi:NAD(P)-dependent dehydrogenase (short-subunit alcohol dehydrogenase family)